MRAHLLFAAVVAISGVSAELDGLAPLYEGINILVDALEKANVGTFIESKPAPTSTTMVTSRATTTSMGSASRPATTSSKPPASTTSEMPSEIFISDVPEPTQFYEPTASIAPCRLPPKPPRVELTLSTLQTLVADMRETFKAFPPLENLTSVPWDTVPISLVYAAGYPYPGNETMNGIRDVGLIQIRFLIDGGKYGYVDFNSSEDRTTFSLPQYFAWGVQYVNTNTTDLADADIVLDFEDAVAEAAFITDSKVDGLAEVALFDPYIVVEACANRSSTYIYIVAFKEDDGRWNSTLLTADDGRVPTNEELSCLRFK